MQLRAIRTTLEKMERELGGVRHARAAFLSPTHPLTAVRCCAARPMNVPVLGGVLV